MLCNKGLDWNLFIGFQTASDNDNTVQPYISKQFTCIYRWFSWAFPRCVENVASPQDPHSSILSSTAQARRELRL